MKVFLSVFKNEKCASCNKAFQITMKRRLCRQCSIFYLEKLFCVDCSKKLKAPELGFFRHKRFCIQCYAIMEKKNRATMPVETSAHLKMQEGGSSEKPQHNSVSMPQGSFNDHHHEYEEEEKKEALNSKVVESDNKEQFEKKKSAFLLGLQRRLSSQFVRAK